MQVIYNFINLSVTYVCRIVKKVSRYKLIWYIFSYCYDLYDNGHILYGIPLQHTMVEYYVLQYFIQCALKKS